MKTIKYFIVITSLALLGLQACMTEEAMDAEPDKIPAAEITPVRFTSATGSGAATRTANSGNDFVTGDSIGIYMTRIADGNAINMSIAENRLFVVKDETKKPLYDLLPAESGQSIYFPVNGDPVWFSAYYPYTPGITDYGYPVNVTNQQDATHIDLLYAKETQGNKGFTRGTLGTNTVKLNFKHQLSKIIINIRRDPGTPNIAQPKSAQINGMPTRAVLQLGDSVVNTLSAEHAGIDMLELPDTASGFDLSLQAIIIPHGIDAGKETVEVLSDRGQFTWPIPFNAGTPVIPENKFKGGKVYTLNLTLQDQGLILFEALIGDWTEYAFTPGVNTGDTTQSRTGRAYSTPVGFDPVTGRYADTLETVFIHPEAPFMMGTSYYPGSNLWPSAPAHKVSLTNAYLLGQTEVTNAQYARFLNAVGATNAGGYIHVPDINALVPLVPSGTNGDTIGNYNATSISLSGSVWTAVAANAQKPVIQTNWYGAMAYATWAGGRLPTEAEWEYAARGTATGDFINGSSNGAGMAASKALGGYAAAPGSGTTDVKTKNPSNWGLYDMFGNAWEWCYDRFLTNNEGYPSNQPVTNPEGTTDAATTFTYAAMRGGGYGDSESRLSIGGSRAINKLDFRDVSVGFRVVFPLK
ncbi:hypothetical protein FACS1894181_15630 [Bacteroidia bacterium]|nr:hypothetical protein FACS1894181_15630 [Bacteroidia bacterium]